MNNKERGKIATCQYGMRCDKVGVAYVVHKTKIILVCSDHLKKFPK